MTRPGFSASTTALRILATASGSTLPSALTRMLRSDRGHHDFSGLARFLQAQRLLDGDFVERIHRHHDIGEFDARSVTLDADLDVEVDHPLYRNKNLHRSFFRSNLRGNDCSGAEPRAPVPLGQRVKGQKLARKASPKGSL